MVEGLLIILGVLIGRLVFPLQKCPKKGISGHNWKTHGVIEHGGEYQECFCCGTRRFKKDFVMMEGTIKEVDWKWVNRTEENALIIEFSKETLRFPNIV